MVFWLWIGLCVLVVPPIAVGLALAAIYLYTRLCGRWPRRSMWWGWF